MSAPYYYFGDKSFAEQVYPSLKDADYDTYQAIRAHYRHTFMESRPYSSAYNARGQDKFGGEWGRTLKNLKELYGYTPPRRNDPSANPVPKKLDPAN